MLHIAMCSFEPLSLKTFMLAVTVVMNNRGLLHDTGIDISPAQGEDKSSTVYLRYLASRSGGLLETDSSVDSLVIADKRAKNVGRSFSRSMLGSQATGQCVQFLHATAKEFVQKHQHRLFVETIEKPLVDFTGPDFLFLCCAITESWIAPIKKDMLSYLDTAEFQDTNETNTGDQLRLRSAVRSAVLKRLVYDEANIDSEEQKKTLRWWLNSRDLIHIRDFLDADNQSPVRRSYLQLVLAATAGAKNLMKYELHSWSGLGDEGYFTHHETVMKDLCLLQLAATGPDVTLSKTYDRIGIIKILISHGYPVDHRTRPPNHYRKTIDTKVKLTTLGLTLVRKPESVDPGETLPIVKYLLLNGANPRTIVVLKSGQSMYLLEYCTMSGSAATVRLLLQHGANPHEFRHEFLRQESALRPIHHALIRQDEAIIEALVENSGESVKELLKPSIKPDPEHADGRRMAIAASVILGTTGHPVIAFTYAQAIEIDRRRSSSYRVKPFYRS